MEYELYHYGTLGMKWGIRRYQNKDGSLTAAGKKRYGTRANFEKVQKAKKAAAKANSPEAKRRAKANARTEEEVNKILQKAGLKKTSEAPKPRTIKDLSDDELRARINRIKLEREYASLTPKKVSAGKKFVDNILIPTATDVAKNVAKDYINKKTKDLLGLNQTNTTEALKKEVEKLNLQKQYKELQKDTSVRDEVTRLTLEKQLKKLKEES